MYLSSTFPVPMLQGLDKERHAGLAVTRQIVMAHGDLDTLRPPVQRGVCEAADVQHIALRLSSAARTSS